MKKLNNQDVRRARKKAALSGPHSSVLTSAWEGCPGDGSSLGTLDHAFYLSAKFNFKNSLLLGQPTLSQVNTPVIATSYSQEAGHIKSIRESLNCLWSLGERKLLRVQTATPRHPWMELAVGTCREVQVTDLFIELCLSNTSRESAKMLSSWLGCYKVRPWLRGQS